MRWLVLALFCLAGCAAPTNRSPLPVSPATKKPLTPASDSLHAAPPEPAPRKAEAGGCTGLASGQPGISDCELDRGVLRTNANKQAEWHARVIRSGVQQWQATNEVTSCPTMSQLLGELMVDRSESGLDPWGHPYTFVCADDEVTVSSDGADGVNGTTDDVSVPKHLAR